MIGELLTIGDVTGRVIRMKDPETVVLFDGKKNHLIKLTGIKDIQRHEEQQICTKCAEEKPINEFRQFKNERRSKMCDDCREKNANAGTIKMKNKRVKVNDTKQGDPVNHPSHYQGLNGLEVREVMDNFVPKYYRYGGLVACDIKDAIKYILRAPDKNGLEDLKKAQRMISYVIDKWEAVE